VGVRKWLFGFDPDEVKDEIKELVEKNKRLEESIQNIGTQLHSLEHQMRILENELKSKVDKDTFALLQRIVEQNGTTIKSLQKEIEDIRVEIESFRLHSEMEQIDMKEMTDEESKALIYNLIKKGYHSATELKRLVPFGVNKLYRLLKELEKDGIIRKIGKKRKTKYIPAEESV